MEEKNKKHYKIMTKVMHIMAKLSRIFLVIGTVFLVISLLVVPIVGNSIKLNTNKQTIEIMNQKFKYEKEDKTYKFYTDDNKINITEEDEVEAVDTILDYVEHGQLPRAILAVELVMFVGMMTLILNYISLRYLDKVFVGINKNDTPFAKEYPDYFRKAGNYLLAVLIVRLIGSFFANIIDTFNISINFGLLDIMLIIALFTIAYIFEYGYKLQSNSDIKMIEQ